MCRGAALCKRQLKERSKDVAAGTPWTTDAEFEAVTLYFQPPSEDERFHVVRHEPDARRRSKERNRVDARRPVQPLVERRPTLRL